MPKPKLVLGHFTLVLLLLFGWQVGYSRSSRPMNSRGPSGTLQKMIVQNATVTMQLDLNRLSTTRSLVAKPVTLHFAAAFNSFFPIIVFNNSMRGPEPGSIELRLENASALPAVLAASLDHVTIEKAGLRSRFELGVRDVRNGFVCFNVEGQQYSYDAEARSLTITGGRLLISREFASALGIPADAGASVG